MSPERPPYRWEAFKTSINLAGLAAGTFLGLVHDPMWFVAVGGLQLASLWIVPDLKSFQQSIDEKHARLQRQKERAYYLDSLWGLADEPKARLPLWKRLFLEAPTVDLDTRILERKSRECRDYLEMQEIVGKLHELKDVRGVRLSEHDLRRLELVISGYLRLVFACAPRQAAVDGVDARALTREMEDLQSEVKSADPAVRAALLERQRLLAQQLDRHPKLKATLHLFRTRAGSSVQQLRQIHGQVLTDPGLDMTTMLNDLMEKQELLTDPLGQLAADQMVRDVLQATSVVPGVDRLREMAGGGTSTSPARARQRS